MPYTQSLLPSPRNTPDPRVDEWAIITEQKTLEEQQVKQY